jgi:hypothetical protein
MSSPFASSFVGSTSSGMFTTSAKSPTLVSGGHAQYVTGAPAYHTGTVGSLAYHHMPMQQQVVGYEVLQQPQYVQTVQMVEQPMMQMQMVEQVQMIEQPMVQVIEQPMVQLVGCQLL